MPGTSKKRGRPRKYGTPKDKAKHDVVAKRARRRLRKQTTHDSIRFQIYVSSQTEASPVTPSQGIESYETSLLGDPPEADSSLNRAESPTLSIDAVVARGEQSPQSIEGNVSESPCLQLLVNMSGPHVARASFSTSQEGPAENSLSSSPDRIPSDPTVLITPRIRS